MSGAAYTLYCYYNECSSDIVPWIVIIFLGILFYWGYRKLKKRKNPNGKCPYCTTGKGICTSGFSSLPKTTLVKK